MATVHTSLPSFASEGALQVAASSWPALQCLTCSLSNTALHQMPDISALTSLHGFTLVLDMYVPDVYVPDAWEMYAQGAGHINMAPLAALTRLTQLRVLPARGDDGPNLPDIRGWSALAALRQLAELDVQFWLSPDESRALLIALGQLPSMPVAALAELVPGSMPGSAAHEGEAATGWRMPAFTSFEVGQAMQRLELLVREPLQVSTVQLLGRALPGLTALIVVAERHGAAQLQPSFASEVALQAVASSWPALQCLACSLPNAAVHQVSALPALTSLHGLTLMLDPNVNPVDMAPLAALTRLTRLCVLPADCYPSDNNLPDMRRLSTLVALQQLAALDVQIWLSPHESRALLIALGQLPNLQDLWLVELAPGSVPGSAAHEGEAASGWRMPALKSLTLGQGPKYAFPIHMSLDAPTALDLITGCPALTYLDCQRLRIALSGGQQAIERMLRGMQALDARGLIPACVELRAPDADDPWVLEADPWVLEAARQAVGAVVGGDIAAGSVAGAGGGDGLRVLGVRSLDARCRLSEALMQWLASLLPNLDDVFYCDAVALPALSALAGLRRVGVRHQSVVEPIPSAEMRRLLSTLHAPEGRTITAYASHAHCFAPVEGSTVVKDFRAAMMAQGVELRCMAS